MIELLRLLLPPFCKPTYSEQRSIAPMIGATMTNTAMDG